MASQPSSPQTPRRSKRSLSKFVFSYFYPGESLSSLLPVGNEPYDEGTPPKKALHRSSSQDGSSETLNVTQIHEMVKANWRSCQNAKDFTKLANMDEFQAEIFDTYYRNSGTSDVQSFIFDKASRCYGSVKGWLQGPNYGGIRWLDPESTNDDDRDIIVALYVALSRVHAPNQDASYKGISRYYRLLKQFSPIPPTFKQTKEQSLVGKSPEIAFHREAKEGRDVAGSVLCQISDCFEQYNSEDFIAPYTSIIGPSGIGKSFAVQQIAREGTYVIYTSLAQPESYVYPRRSVLANYIADFNDRDEMTVFFESFIGASLVNVQLCKQLGISPIGLFDIIVKGSFFNFQDRLCKLVQELYWNVNENLISAQEPPRTRSGDSDDQDATFYQDHVTRALPRYRKHAMEVFSSIHKLFKSRPEYESLYLAAGGQLAPKDQFVILCFDEAKQLFENLPPQQQDVRFLALRRAMRHQTEVARHKDVKRFFGLLMDTTAKISDFAPPQDEDSSLARFEINEFNLIDPIFKINTMDIHAPEEDMGWKQLREASESTAPDDITHLYQLGRPLWGSLLHNNSPNFVRHVARKKLFGGRSIKQGEKWDPVKALALLSYRVNFYVAIPALANTLTASHLRYIVGIGEGRKFLQTVQPSEPVLAISSTEHMMKDPQIRLDIIKALYDSTTKGTIHLGDIGEMVSSLLLLFTFDKAHGERSAGPMKLSRFFESLLSSTSPVLEGIINRMEDQEDLRNLWHDGVVFFNHVVRLTKPPTAATLRKAFYRGAAFFPPGGFKGCDIVIPIYLPPKDATSYFLLQIKNRAGDTLSADLCNEAKSSLKSAAKLMPPSNSGHISLLMSLRANENQEKAAIAYPAVAHKKKTRANKKMKKEKKTKYAFNDMKRVVVVATGMSMNLYPGFTHPKEDGKSDQKTSAESLRILKKLLSCTSETHHDLESEYHSGLDTLG